VAYVGALDTRNGTIRRLTDVKGAMLFKVTSFAFDPSSGTAFFTNDNKMFRDLMTVDVKTGETRMLLEDARIGDLVFNRSDRSLLGVRHLNGLSTLVRIPYPYTDFNQVHTFAYGVEMYDLDISPDGKLLSASMAEISGDQFLRVFDLAKVLGGDVKPMSAISTAAATTRVSPTSSATRSPTARSRRYRTPSRASSGRSPSPTGAWSSSTTRAPDSCPRPSIRSRSRT
jgi:hypothetical protein